MRFKLDENIGNRGLEMLRAAGHDVTTVADQGMGGAADQRLFEVCANEQRALITMDHDFGHVLRFPPERSGGIVILELLSQPSGYRALFLTMATRRPQLATLTRPRLHNAVACGLPPTGAKALPDRAKTPSVIILAPTTVRRPKRDQICSLTI